MGSDKENLNLEEEEKDKVEQNPLTFED